MYEALRKGATVDEIFDITKVKHYFVEQMKELVEEEEAIAKSKGSLPSDEQLISAKKNGFSDKYFRFLRFRKMTSAIRESNLALRRPGKVFT